jgi:hypothetical protein
MRRMSTYLRFLSYMIAALLLQAGRLPAQSGTLTDDAFLASTPPTQLLNLNGQGVSLIVAGSSCPRPAGMSTAYLKFQLQASLPVPVSGASVAKATLKLFVTPASTPSGIQTPVGGSDGVIDVYPVATPWTESTLTPSAAPALAATPVASTIAVTNAGSFLTIDLTRLVQAWINGAANGGLDNNGIALTPHTPTTCAVFDSKENVLTGHEPRLEIVLAGLPGPPGPSGTSGFANFSCSAGKSITGFDSAARPICGTTSSGGGGSLTDSDSDGIPDAIDPCPLAPNVNYNGGSYCPAFVYDVNRVTLSPGATVVLSNLSVTNINGSSMTVAVLPTDLNYQGPNGASLTMNLGALTAPAVVTGSPSSAW